MIIADLPTFVFILLLMIEILGIKRPGLHISQLAFVNFNRYKLFKINFYSCGFDNFLKKKDKTNIEKLSKPM